MVVDGDDHDNLHPMSYVDTDSSVLTGEFRTPQDQMAKIKLDSYIHCSPCVFRTQAQYCYQPWHWIARRSCSTCGGGGDARLGRIVNRARNFRRDSYIRAFGPSYNADAIIELNQVFDFYDGGGLDMSFLGAAQVSKSGDVNVSRMSKSRLTGPGGFIDISQSTKNLYFMTPFTTKGLELNIPGDGTL